MPTMTAPPAAKPATSRLALFVAGLAEPLAALATLVFGLLLLVLGVLKFIPPGTVDAPVSSASADLASLASGGVITAPWGIYLVGALQVALGLGLLVPAARAMAAYWSSRAGVSISHCSWRAGSKPAVLPGPAA